MKYTICICFLILYEHAHTINVVLVSEAQERQYPDPLLTEGYPQSALEQQQGGFFRTVEEKLSNFGTYLWENLENGLETIKGLVSGGEEGFLSRQSFESTISNFLPSLPTLNDLKQRPIVFFDVEIDGAPSGRIMIELFHKTAPRTAENFRVLATGMFTRYCCFPSPINVF